MPRTAGFSLAELLIAMGIGAFLVTGILSLAQAATSGFRLQQALGQVQENARFATGAIEATIRQAGYDPRPWLAAQPTVAVAAGTADAFNATGDRLVLRRWSDRNCFENTNPDLDPGGLPRYYLLESAFHVNAAGNLVQSCRYGPDAGQLVTQLNNLGMVEGVESLQVQFAEDGDNDGNADRWIRAGQWQEEDRLLGVRFAMLLASPNPAGDRKPQFFVVLDQLTASPADGKLRGVFQSAAAIAGRAQ